MNIVRAAEVTSCLRLPFWFESDTHMSLLLFLLLSCGWMDACDGWMNVPAAGRPSVHPSLSEEVTSRVTGGVGGW